MSTIKSSAENLTLNADGANNDIKFQSNGSEVASIDQAGNIALSGTVDGIDIATRDAILTSTTTTAGAALPKTGGTMTGHVNFGDSKQLRLGASNDLSLYHDGNNSYINEEGTGILSISSNGTGVDINKGTSEYMGRFIIDGSVELYHNNSKKFETTSTGTTVSRGLFTNGIEITDGSTEDCLKITASSSDHNLARWEGSNSTSSQQSIMQFYRNGGLRGSISTSNSATAFNTSSDYRLKENVDYTWDATTRLKQLKPARFNWIEDETNTLVDGFIAHEVTSVVPEAVCGAKDAVDSDSNPEYQGIDQSKLVPLLVKTIQELEARITALEA